MARMSIRSVQNTDCRLQTGYTMQTRYKMQTEYKMQTDKKNFFYVRNESTFDFITYQLLVVSIEKCGTASEVLCGRCFYVI